MILASSWSNWRWAVPNGPHRPVEGRSKSANCWWAVATVVWSWRSWAMLTSVPLLALARAFTWRSKVPPVVADVPKIVDQLEEALTLGVEKRQHSEGRETEGGAKLLVGLAGFGRHLVESSQGRGAAGRGDEIVLVADGASDGGVRLVEQGAGTAEGTVGRESGDEQKDDGHRHHSSRDYEDRAPRAFGAVPHAASMPMLRSMPVLSPVAHPVAIRVGATLPAMLVRGRLRA